MRASQLRTYALDDIGFDARGDSVRIDAAMYPLSLTASRVQSGLPQQHDVAVLDPMDYESDASAVPLTLYNRRMRHKPTGHAGYA